MLKPACKKWWALYGVTPIVESVLQVHRHHNILIKWGLLSKTDVSEPELNNEESFINALVRFPLSVLPKSKQTDLLSNNKRLAETGCLQMDLLDLTDIPVDVPIVVWFHGGGLTFGVI